MIDAGAALSRLLRRIDETEKAGPEEGFPHYADPDTGRWIRSPTGDWTGGFWIGMLWLAAAFTDDERYRELARAWTVALRSREESDTVFRGFLFWYGAAHGARLHSDEQAREVALGAARALAASYLPTARVIPLGAEAEEASDIGRGETNIDGVPGTTSLLAWAAGETGEESLRRIAVAHADRHVELCVRANHSVVQSATLDPETGQVLRRYTHKGVRDDSTWTRAQAWAMLGYAQASVVDAARFMPVLRRVADWWVDHLPPAGVAFWDFDAAAPPLDTSGTAIGSAALLKAADLVPERAGVYRPTAERSIGALVERHLNDRGILRDGCYNQRIGLATANELIWGDYFLFESLGVLDGAIEPIAV